MRQQKAFLILLAMSSASPAIAQSQPAANGDKLPHVAVRFNDLDLSAAPGIRVLESRVRHAVSTLCSDDGARDLRSKMEVQACTDVTLQRATLAIARAARQNGAQAAAAGSEKTLARR